MIRHRISPTPGASGWQGPRCRRTGWAGTTRVRKHPGGLAARVV